VQDFRGDKPRKRGDDSTLEKKRGAESSRNNALSPPTVAYVRGEGSSDRRIVDGNRSERAGHHQSPRGKIVPDEKGTISRGAKFGGLSERGKSYTKLIQSKGILKRWGGALKVRTRCHYCSGERHGKGADDGGNDRRGN